MTGDSEKHPFRVPRARDKGGRRSSGHEWSLTELSSGPGLSGVTRTGPVAVCPHKSTTNGSDTPSIRGFSRGSHVVSEPFATSECTPEIREVSIRGLGSHGVHYPQGEDSHVVNPSSGDVHLNDPDSSTLRPRRRPRRPPASILTARCDPHPQTRYAFRPPLHPHTRPLSPDRRRE